MIDCCRCPVRARKSYVTECGYFCLCSQQLFEQSGSEHRYGPITALSRPALGHTEALSISPYGCPTCMGLSFHLCTKRVSWINLLPRQGIQPQFLGHAARIPATILNVVLRQRLWHTTNSDVKSTACKWTNLMSEVCGQFCPCRSTHVW